ncbi:hypothetical protein BWI93_15295 [Siphonobacter sp. BAB-5385]|nr:choice-of-anchor A family protein [Siphonobacter sp. BAB-5385]OZI07378.1 hypothetical protein BWI93_15295 [Siphonobacter sp. BAB-5385]
MQFISTLRNSLAAAVLTSLAVTAHAQNPLSPAMGFNVMVRDNLTVSSNETDGPMAAGGNFIIKGGYQVNIHEVGTYRGTGTNIIGLYVGNQVIFESGNTVKIGNGRYVKIGNLSNTDVSNGNHQTESTRIVKKGFSRDSNPRIELALTQPVDKVPIGEGEKIDFETIYKNFEVASHDISFCSTNATLVTPNGEPITSTQIPGHGQVKVVLKANTVNTLNISGEDLNRIVSIGFSGSVQRPNASTPFVINVSVNGTFNWNPFNFTGIGDQDGQFILFNFHQTSKILLTGQNNTIKGSLLAPSADVIKSISSNIDGQVIARSYDQSGGENHYQLFNASVPGCKETSLPVELSYFKAEANNQQQAVLTWGTSQEVNSAYFIVEKVAMVKPSKAFVRYPLKGSRNKLRPTRLSMNRRPMESTTTASNKSIRMAAVRYSVVFPSLSIPPKIVCFPYTPTPVGDQPSAYAFRTKPRRFSCKPYKAYVYPYRFHPLRRRSG